MDKADIGTVVCACCCSCCLYADNYCLFLAPCCLLFPLHSPKFGSLVLTSCSPLAALLQTDGVDCAFVVPNPDANATVAAVFVELADGRNVSVTRVQGHRGDWCYTPCTKGNVCDARPRYANCMHGLFN